MCWDALVTAGVHWAPFAKATSHSTGPAEKLGALHWDQHWEQHCHTPRPRSSPTQVLHALSPLQPVSLPRQPKGPLGGEWAPPLPFWGPHPAAELRPHWGSTMSAAHSPLASGPARVLTCLPGSAQLVFSPKLTLFVPYSKDNQAAIFTIKPHCQLISLEMQWSL